MPKSTRDKPPVERVLAKAPDAETTWQAQRNLLHATLASIDDAIITTDARDRITFLNPAAAALTGWTQEEAADLPLDAVFRTVREGEVQASENLGRPRRGSARPPALPATRY